MTLVSCRVSRTRRRWLIELVIVNRIAAAHQNNFKLIFLILHQNWKKNLFQYYLQN